MAGLLRLRFEVFGMRFLRQSRAFLFTSMRGSFSPVAGLNVEFLGGAGET